jgi:hypothetical protein
MPIEASPYAKLSKRSRNDDSWHFTPIKLTGGCSPRLHLLHMVESFFGTKAKKPLGPRVYRKRLKVAFADEWIGARCG